MFKNLGKLKTSLPSVFNSFRRQAPIITLLLPTLEYRRWLADYFLYEKKKELNIASWLQQNSKMIS